MKNNKVLIIIVVLLLNILVGFMVGQAFLGKESEHDILLKQARGYVEEELYRKAIGYYEEALGYEDSLETRIEMVQVYEKAVENGEYTNLNTVYSYVKDIVELYPDEAAAYEAACESLAKYEQYKTCAELLVQAKERKITSQKLEEILSQVRYTHKLSYTMYSNVSSFYNGSYLVQTDDVYSLVDGELGTLVADGFSYASSFSEGYAFVRQGSTEGDYRSFVVSRGGVRQCYLDGVTESSGVGMGTDANGEPILLLAGKTGERYQYYNMKGEPVFGDYLFAGRFRNNVAAVQEGENAWRLINAQGQPIVDTVFEDVILNEFGECAPKGLIFAKSNGKYGLYHMSGSRIGDFTCDDARAFVDGVTAFKSGERWGFVNASGEVVIEPQYEDAKAFSKGIAGVCQNGFWSFIDSSNQVVIEGTYEDAGYLSENGKCFAKLNGRWIVLQMYYVAN